MANTKGKLIFTCPATSSKGRKNPPLFNKKYFLLVQVFQLQGIRAQNYYHGHHDHHDGLGDHDDHDGHGDYDDRNAFLTELVLNAASIALDSKP